MAGKGRPSSNREALARASTGEQQSALGVVGAIDQPSLTRQTPYQRMQDLLASCANGDGTGAITTVDELITHVRANPNPGRVVIRMKLLWVSDHQHKEWKFARLHFIDANSPEPLEKMLEIFRDQYADNAHDVDSLLFTATAWDVAMDDSNLPPPGSIVLISDCSHLGLFRDSQCQATVRLSNLTWS